MTRARLGAMVAIVAACGPIASAPPLPAPLNACPANPCSLYKPFQSGGVDALCNRGICSVKATIDYTLVVSLPETSYYAPGQTFVVPASQLFARQPTERCPVGLCSHLAGVGVVNGQYRPTPKVQEDVGYYIGQVAALPVRVTYRPLAAPPNAAAPPATSDATSAGLPLLPTLAEVVFPIDGVPGPGSGPNPGFRAILPPGTYERTIAPEPPYDAAFPPDVVTVTVASGVQSLSAGSATVALDTIPGNPASRPHFDTMNNEFVRADGAPLDGWRVHIRDQATRRRLSTQILLGDANRVTASPATYHAIVDLNHHPAPVPPAMSDTTKGTELVLEPPPGSDAMPTLVAPWLAGTLRVPAYPLTPVPAIVRGSVTVSGGSAPASALLLFRSKKIYITTADATFTTNLVYEARVTAVPSGSGADARYSVRLPRGEYDVIVIPTDGGAAKSIFTTTVSIDLDTQDGKDFALKPKRGVRGVARVSDGRPLAGAKIIATPASTLAASGLDPDRWPRLASTSTDADGSFVLRLDPGTYDISVRPADGSRLPWVVVPARAIQAGDSDLVLSDPIDVPAPIGVGLALADPQDNPIVRALVRAFAVPTGGAAFVEVGRALTDDTGRYELYLAGTPHP